MNDRRLANIASLGLLSAVACIAYIEDQHDKEILGLVADPHIEVMRGNRNAALSVLTYTCKAVCEDHSGYPEFRRTYSGGFTCRCTRAPLPRDDEGKLVITNNAFLTDLSCESDGTPDELSIVDIDPGLEHKLIYCDGLKELTADQWLNRAFEVGNLETK